MCVFQADGLVVVLIANSLNQQKMLTGACSTVTPRMPRSFSSWDGCTTNRAQTTTAKNKPLNIWRNPSIPV